jgi:ABC-2 type transport system ATP-binding protein
MIPPRSVRPDLLAATVGDAIAACPLASATPGSAIGGTRPTRLPLVIRSEGLTKRYGARTAVDDLSFEVRSGTVTGFLGPNGAGKSTTMRMIMGLDVPDAGSSTLNGKRIHDIDAPMREVGVLLDAGYLHPTRKAANHLWALAASNCIPRSRVDEVLGLVGLTEVAGQRVGKFSLGMKQRLGIAAALLGDPSIIILDEPANGLDPEGVHWIRTFLSYLADQGRTVFVSSHLLSEMALMADDLVIIGNGRLIAETNVRSLTADAGGASVFVRGPDIAGLRQVIIGAGGSVDDGDDGLVVTDLDAPTIGNLAYAARLELHELSPRSTSLEDAFLRLTADAQEYRTSTTGEAGA